MADVATNAHSSNTTEKNGSVVTGVDKKGNKHTIDPTINSTVDPSVLEVRLTNRFDDPDYYGA